MSLTVYDNVFTDPIVAYSLTVNSYLSQPVNYRLKYPNYVGNIHPKKVFKAYCSYH